MKASRASVSRQTRQHRLPDISCKTMLISSIWLGLCALQTAPKMGRSAFWTMCNHIQSIATIYPGSHLPCLLQRSHLQSCIPPQDDLFCHRRQVLFCPSAGKRRYLERMEIISSSCSLQRTIDSSSKLFMDGQATVVE